MKIDSLIMVDAALKLEGETTGEIAEGIGAAIGGIGVEKFRIEKAAVDKDIPMYAVVVKQSLIDAISVMKKEIAEASDKTVAVVQRIIEEKTKEGDTVSDHRCRKHVGSCPVSGAEELWHKCFLQSAKNAQHAGLHSGRMPSLRN